MVYKRGGAVPNGVQQGNQRAVIAILGRQCRVEPPPQVLEDVHEVPSGLCLGEAAGKRAVEVRVGIDEAGEHYFARGVYTLAREALEPVLGGDLSDVAVLDKDGVMGQDSRGFPSGQDGAVFYEQGHHQLHRYKSYKGCNVT